MTVAIRNDGQFRQWQVGLQDIPVHITFANNLRKWTGAVTAVQNFFKFIPNLIKQETVEDLGFNQGIS